MRIPTLVLLCACLAATACAQTQRATFGTVPRERRTECERHCAQIDLQLAAVVIVRSSAGCVCELPEARASGTLVSASAVTAAAAAMIVDEEVEAASRDHEAPTPTPSPDPAHPSSATPGTPGLR